MVRHSNASHTFETGLSQLPARHEVKWFAFYSDYQHEVREVTAGVRITLIYNLFTSEPKLPLQVCFVPFEQIETTTTSAVAEIGQPNHIP